MLSFFLSFLSQLGEGEEGSGSLDASVDIEVDSTYNTEQDPGRSHDCHMTWCCRLPHI